ncbi:MAG: amidohydrolase family protein [Halioglobus sp.]|nr:amidohydrolase family protein [Halioglobus sp.]
MRFVTCVLVTLFCAALAQAGELTVYTAKKIITMEPALPAATAVAVDAGRVVAVGDLESLGSWIGERGATVDDRFADKVLLPGFIDPHLHPSLPAVITQFPVIAPDDWSLPTGEFPGALTAADYREKLTRFVARHSDEGIPFVTWGFHSLWHGDIGRAELNDWFGAQAVILWHRSFHELIMNDAALGMLGITEEEAALPGVDWERGLFSEGGAAAVLPKMQFLFDPARYAAGLGNLLAMMHRGGVTTALDMGTGVFGNPALEIGLIRGLMNKAQPPARLILTPIITDFLGRGKTIDEAMAEIDEWRAGNNDQVFVDRRFKLMLDGAIFSGLSQFDFPGYMDGHHGEWLVPLKVTAKWAQAFWDAGYQLHAHTNGDKSAAAMLDLLRTLLENTPRSDHRFSLEHFAYTTEDQNRQLKALGAVVSANPYYQYILSDIYSERWLGEDRGRQMVRLGSLERLGVPFALHSDCPMAPLSPLTLADAAVNRVTINGNLNAVQERISLDAALRAITIDAAWVMGYEDEIGSIRAGKRADFTVLEQDPYRVPSRKLKDIPVWGVVFAGEPYPVVNR